MNPPVLSRSFALAAAAALILTPLSGQEKKDPVQARERPVTSAGTHVPVPLGPAANDGSGLAFPDRFVTVGGIPFDLTGDSGADNLFLHEACWPKWSEDPSRYYADYDSAPATPGDPLRPFFRVPVTDYQAVYLLATAEDDEAFSQTVSLRIGAFDGPRRTTIHDFSAEVPRRHGRRTAQTVLEIPAGGEAGKLYLVRVPLGKAIAQDFASEWALDVEVTKELRLAVRRPDPNRYLIRPLGPPSGVHIHGITFARSEVQMRVTSAEKGHVFNQPAVPTFHVSLENVERRKIPLVIEAEATDARGEKTVVISDELVLDPYRRLERDLSLPVPNRGWHRLTVSLKRGRTVLLRRETSFAVLPPDTRRHRETSPFGTWDFGGAHFTAREADDVGPLYAKAGLRYGMFPFSAEERRRHGVLAGNEPRSADLLAGKLEEDPDFPQNVLIFHENAISGPHIMRTPDVFTGRGPYAFDEKEKEKFDQLWEEAHAAAREVRERFPDAKIKFGNGNPHLLEEFLRRKFPKELFDARGNEAGSFMRPPETQPLDFVSNNAGLWMDRQILDHYGYADKPVWQCYEITYPSTNPGNLSERTQAAYLVRHAMHSLAWGVPVIRQGCICDVGNSYYYSNWGATGFCHAFPELNPKPAYVAIATLTWQLDGAAHTRTLDTGSPTTYAMEFKKAGDEGFVTVLWTIRGRRSARLDCPGGIAGAVDLAGNATSAEPTLLLSPEPVFVSTPKPVTAIALDPAEYAPMPQGKASKLSSLSRLAEWELEADRDAVLENHNFENPRRKGGLDLAETAEFEGEKAVLSVSPVFPGEGSAHLPIYAALKSKKPEGIPVPGEPTEIGLKINGNGGWGRVIFEMTDASGQVWTSIGAAQAGDPPRWMEDWMSPEELARMGAVSVGDWNTNDSWQRSRINFEGWRFLRFPLPGNYPGEGYHWPYSSQWRHTGDGVVHYPLSFRRLVFEFPEKILHGTETRTVPRREIYLKDLMVTYRPPAEAFVAEELD
ncbi:MAG: hypothetical protein H7A53_00105 [Akkermansiaceae bacterium]|nr:hypothetical protein [Akkermansiaceae bacterium]MCP5549286.1 hypothetical protein [Akkermansiaceae bacterium]